MALHTAQLTPFAGHTACYVMKKHIIYSGCRFLTIFPRKPFKTHNSKVHYIRFVNILIDYWNEFQ